MEGEKYKIGNVEFKTEEEYKEAVSDLKTIKEIKEKYDTNDPKQADMILFMVQKNPQIFQSVFGKAFVKGLKKTVSENEEKIEENKTETKEINQTKKKPKKKKKIWIWVIGGIFALGIIGNLFGSGENEEKNGKSKGEEQEIIEKNEKDDTSKNDKNEENEEDDTEDSVSEFDEEISSFATGEYLYITNDDLNTYCVNMEGAKVYVVTDIDDMKDGKIQSTLSDGFMMSNFDVGEKYSKYESVLKKGDLIAIFGTVSGYDGYSFMGKCVNLEGCQVFAVGEEAKTYQKESSDPGLSGYLVATEEVAESGGEVSEEEYKSLCQSLDYEGILRNPDENKGKYCLVSGNVEQIIEGWFGSFTIFVTDESGNKWGCVYSYKEGESRLLEGDWVTMYGKCAGTENTTTLLGQQVTLPRIDVEYVN